MGSHILECAIRLSDNQTPVYASIGHHGIFRHLARAWTWSLRMLGCCVCSTIDIYGSTGVTVNTHMVRPWLIKMQAVYGEATHC